MINIKIVLIESKYQINLGYIARIAKNFGLKKIYLINPKCKFNGINAIKYSKHAHDLLENAIVYKNLSQASRNCFVIGTTGIWTKSSASFFNITDPEGLIKIIKNSKIHNICLLIGRDNTGLTKEELKHCDINVFIPANPKYPILNISHALAILLYELTKLNFKKQYFFSKLYADQIQTYNTISLFKDFMYNKAYIRDKKAIAMIFEHILKRSHPTKTELKALNIAFHNQK